MKKKEKRFPILCIIIYCFTLLSLGLYIAFRFRADFASTFNASVSQFLRHVLARCTYWIPFSLAEWLFLSLPILLALLIFLGVRAIKQGGSHFRSYLGALLSIVCIVFCAFVWTFAPGYSATGVDKKLEIERAPVSDTDLLRAAFSLTEEVNTLSRNLSADENGSTSMPYSFDTLNRYMLAAYEDFADDTGILTTYYSSVKPVMTSPLLSYAHITGIYSFPTGEANINIDFPDYTIPFTVAHEMAHQRGIAREDEANFVAYLVCMKSDDPYIQYSGAMNLWEYVMAAMYESDGELYELLYKVLEEVPKNEETAYAAFYQKYADNKLATVNDHINDAYLKSQGEKEGTKSYNLVVDLAVAYFKSIERIPQN